MTTNQRTIVRTPRRKKVWAVTNASTVVASSGQADLLDGLAAALGMTNLQGVTHMRTIGRVKLVERAIAGTPDHDTYQLGIAWLTVGEQTTLPTPLQDGERDTQWIATGLVEGEEQSSGVLFGRGAIAYPPEHNTWEFDTQMMRKQPGPKAELTLVWKARSSGFEGSTMGLDIFTQTMLALP